MKLFIFQQMNYFSKMNLLVYRIMNHGKKLLNLVGDGIYNVVVGIESEGIDNYMVLYKIVILSKIMNGGISLDKRFIRFIFEEIVEVYDPTISTRLNGTVDCIQTTEGNAEIINNEVINLIIDKCEVNVGGKKLTNTKVLKNKDGYVKILNGVLR